MTIARLVTALRHALAVGFAALASSAAAEPIKTIAPYAFVMDYDTESVLLDEKGDQLMIPASMAKLMTMAIVFEDLKAGRLKLDDMFTVSENAWRRGGAASGGSSMFAALNSSIKVVDLLQGVIVQSANDACIILAEGIAGTEEAFVERMNRRAKEIGLVRSRFKNTTGLPDPEQRVTARELAFLTRHIIRTYPEYYKYYSQREFTWNKIRQYNRNPLLAMNMGADGAKTGHTDESGYGLVASAERNGQRLILVINGLKTLKSRAEEARKLIDWGYRAFDRILLYPAGEVVAEARVFGGAKSYVPLVGDGNIALLVPRGEAKDFRGRIVYEGPVPAPVHQGQRIGKFRVLGGEGVVLERDLYAREDVEQGSWSRRAVDAMGELVMGLWY